jgi:DNA-binding transcriptional LysR family regulator
MDVKDLRYFVAVFEAKNFSRASEVLGTVQSNVSARIRNLEEFLEVELFQRHYRGIIPNEKAIKLYQHAKHVLASVEQTPSLVKPDPRRLARQWKIS